MNDQEKIKARLANMLDWLLSTVGFYQAWHICWVAKIDSTKTATCDGVFYARPRMRAESIEKLRTKLASDTGCDVKYVNITAMTKIGR